MGIRRVRRLVTVVVFVLTASASSTGRATPDAGSVCRMTEQDRRWVEGALDGWERVSRDSLQIGPIPAPWMVLFDATCVWHFGGERRLFSDSALAPPLFHFAASPVPAWVTPHGGLVKLPNSVEIPATKMAAFTSLYDNESKAFFVMALPDIWGPIYGNGPRQADFFQGVLIHELTHTRHLVAIRRRLAEVLLAYHAGDIDLDDDIVQNRFADVPGFREAFERERDLFFRAAAEPEANRRRALAKRALAMVRHRRQHYFRGRNRMYAELEDLFLSMEGAGQWAAYQFARARAGSREDFDVPLVELVRDNRKFWSQEEGLAMFLLLDAMTTGWQARVFAPTPAEPVTLLDEAVKAER